MAAISRLMPNIGGSISGKRAVLAEVVNSTLFYMILVLTDRLRVNKYKCQICRWRTALKVVPEKKIVLIDTVVVVAGMILIHLPAEERRRIYLEEREKELVKKW